MDYERAHYDDGGVACEDDCLVIQRYYPWGARRVQYTDIAGISVVPLTGWATIERYRLYGSGDLTRWWNLDAQRPTKTIALVIDVGGRFKPAVTPTDPAAFERILRAHVRVAQSPVRLAPPIRVPEQATTTGDVRRVRQREVAEMVPEPTTRVSS